MLKLRRGKVVSIDPLTVKVGDEERRAWADESMVGEVREGDEVIVNVEALDLELGSGGFDVVHANLTRGLEGGGAEGDEHVMKLNYTSLQHPVDPVEVQYDRSIEPWGEELSMPVLAISLHGQLAPAAWAAARAAPGLRVGYLQTAGAALPGGLSHAVRELLARGQLAGHVTAGPAYGAEHEAISIAGGLHAGARTLGWDAAIAGPGPGILGSASALGHGGMAALDVAHAALSLGMPTLVAPRLSSGDPRARHRGLSHHSRAVLRMMLGPVRVPVPADEAGEVLPQLLSVCSDKHTLWAGYADLDGYAASGLPATTMGRGIDEDRLFFAAALAAGDALGALSRQDQPE